MKKPWVVLAAICATMLFQGAQIGGIQVLPVSYTHLTLPTIA